METTRVSLPVGKLVDPLNHGEKDQGISPKIVMISKKNGKIGDHPTNNKW